MSRYLPGTAIELKEETRNEAKAILDNLFLSGGLVLSQVTRLTGLEPYEVQNWVKRGFLPPPSHKMYDRNQFCRIVTINMLRETMQIDTITRLLRYINGQLDDTSDDLIDDSELYNYYVNLLLMMGEHLPEEEELRSHILRATGDYEEIVPGSRQRLFRVLEIMLYSFYSARLRGRAEELLKTLDDGGENRPAGKERK